MKHDAEDIIVDGQSGKSEKAVAIAKSMKQYEQSFRYRLNEWFFKKGWIYLMVFIMGILTGGLIFK